MFDGLSTPQISREGVAVTGLDDNLVVRFYDEPVYMAAKSEAAGRPIYSQVTMVSIIPAGTNKQEVVRKARQEDKERFARAWTAYEKQHTTADVEGTLVENWPPLNRAQVAMLKHLNIFTVESLANLSEAFLSNLGPGGRDLIAMAKAYLDTAADNAVAQHMAAENQRLHTEISDLKGQLNALGAQVAQFMKQSGQAPQAPSIAAQSLQLPTYGDTMPDSDLRGKVVSAKVDEAASEAVVKNPYRQRSKAAA